MPVPIDVAALAPPAHALVAPVGSTWSTVVVKAGDTLWHLALRHHTTVDALVARNRLSRGGAVLHVGQRLLVPGAGAQTGTPRPGAKPTGPTKPTAGTPGASTRVHVVAAGDTMSGIAQRYGRTLAQLLAANPLRNPALIRIGQRITIPGAGSPSVPKPAPTKRAHTKPTTAKPTTAKPTPTASWPDATKATVAQSEARLAQTVVPSRTATAALIRTTAARHGVDPRLALAIGWRESSWNQRAVSYVGALGVMQVMPTSGIWASQLAGRKLDLYDVDDNITAGVLILRALQTQADSREQAIAGYYQGLYSVRKHGMFSDTRAYVASILEHYARM